MCESLPILVLRGRVFFPRTQEDFSVEGHFWSEIFRQLESNSKVFILPELEKEFGCVCTLTLLKSRERDAFKIKVEGLYRGRLLNYSELSGEREESNYQFPLHHGEVVPSLEKEYNDSECKSMILKFLSKKPKILGLTHKKMRELMNEIKYDEVNLSHAVDRITNSLKSNCRRNLEAKRYVLASNSLLDRISFLDRFYEETIVRIVDEDISKKVKKNIDKQQHDFILREKLKVIKEELGDTFPKDVEVAKLRKKLEKGKYPEHVVAKAKEELRRYELCSSFSNESIAIKSYLDWLLALPWNDFSEDETDLHKVSEVLDKYHWGLEKVKERILEFIAVKNKLKNDSKGSIICFVGPPGVGKTSLAISIAEALKKKFAKVSLGGVHDESEIRGHRRTYVAAMPGRIIRSLKMTQTKNPVILLDEIDKLSSSYNGDPMHALLEVLDPNQSSKFSDHYIEEEFDLSKVMFIATANYEENIPDPLLDRMEMIQLRSYTEMEKLHIAKSHLIAEVLAENGLTDKELTFEDEALMLIIQRYTREAGVRNLKQNLSKIARKFVKRQSMSKLKKQKITAKQVKEYLEYEVYDFTRRDEDGIPGVVNGMAYTESGGDLLPIEVNHMTGKGNLSLTGNLKDTMRESASVALAYVRANEEFFDLKHKEVDWNNIDINLHVPSGGIPKDGPSAGVTITTALISSFSGKAVSPKVAMTGEITLRGKVLPIGGLREKVVSAVRGGIDTIFYPEENTKNLIDIPQDVRDKITLIPVKYYSEIYSHLFAK